MRPSPIYLLALLAAVFLPLRAPAEQQPTSANHVATSADRVATSADHVAGQVLNALDQHPLSGAAVTLRDTNSARSFFSATADQDGRFAFTAVPAGKYVLAATLPGYLSSSYQQHGNFWTAIITGAGLPTESLLLQLTPMSTIAGRVVDEAGDGLQHASLTLYHETLTDSPTRISHFRSAQTSDEGDYEFDNLPPGRYFLSASAIPWYAVHPPLDQKNSTPAYRISVDSALDVAYPMLFYPHALNPDEASPIEIRGGDSIRADLQMLAQPALSITLQLRPGERPGQRNTQITRSIFGSDQFFPQQMDFSDTTQRITGLAPGQYKLREFVNGTSIPIGLTPVDLTSSSTSVELAKPAGLSTVSVTLHTAQADPLPPKLRLNLRNMASNTSSGVPLNDQNIAVFPNIPAGDYRLTLVGNNGPWSILTLAAAGQSASDKILHVSAAATLSVDITASNRAITLNGFVRRDGRPDGQPTPGSMVVLVPAVPSPADDLFRRDQSNLDGSFSLPNIAPGNYILIAIDDGWSLRWNDISALTPYLLRGTPIAISSTSPSVIRQTIPSQAR